MRCPSSPGHGIESRPGSSFWYFTHITLRPLVFVDGTGAGVVGPQESAMGKIVLDLSGRQQRQFGVDRERETLVRGAQCALDSGGLVAAREDEPEIARPFGQRQQQLIRLGADVN